MSLSPTADTSAPPREKLFADVPFMVRFGLFWIGLMLAVAASADVLQAALKRISANLSILRGKPLGERRYMWKGGY